MHLEDVKDDTEALMPLSPSDVKKGLQLRRSLFLREKPEWRYVLTSRQP